MLAPTRRQAWRICHVAAKCLIRSLGIPFSVAWQADADLTRSHIIVANHCSYVDSMFLTAVLPDAHIFVAKTELQRNPVLRACLRKLGTIFIERFEPLPSSAELTRLQLELAKGNSLVVFPEGTFTRVT
jgi:1-acyl-sn-glycerol-3-phosphate acyltransferase